MAALELAAIAGVDYVEFDVQATRDGVLVVLHDDDLARTTDGRGRVADLRWDALRRLDAGAWFGPRFRGQRIPTLADVLDWLAAKPAVGATVEAKGEGTGGPIAAALLERPWRLRLSICSFEASELRAAAAVAPDVPRVLIVDRDVPDLDPLPVATDASATGVNVPWDRCTAASVDRLHRAGLLVAGGTADDARGVAACLAVGLDAVDTNDPVMVLAVRDALQRAPVAMGELP